MTGLLRTGLCREIITEVCHTFVAGLSRGCCSWP
jgi:hypothetical protein